ncbi:tRNA isopentenyl-2-thiomethyl-A-37 hydroxylase MiaE [Colwellia psychrerythraea]|uniref:tRNA-hydroxylase n=1 Tax=Colwellia psychrerythraea TaxID=28229 RepID=A0A099L1N6_COLPS|nr:tRNA isopentenyl-2-thiomethyl-A-37 hydroxylase MiaE [Colwellia psychrerythraea]KGJ96360.1 tRNA-hydroxylase [Colwellia psychrerythraea]
MTEAEQLLIPILNFLTCETPDAWIDEAKKKENLPIILRDHLACELKAGQTAMFLIRKYAIDKESNKVLLEWFQPYEDFLYRKRGDLASLANKNNISKAIFPKSNTAQGQSPFSQNLIDKMVLLIKEELHHFYQVLEIMVKRDIPFDGITAGRYAKGMLKHVTTYEPNALIDKLIIGAFIEARSCERFAKLAPHLDDELNKFYVSLLRSEARHYQDYLALAAQVAGEGVDISERISYFAKVEAELISSPDEDFKFHSGSPI